MTTPALRRSGRNLQPPASTRSSQIASRRTVSAPKLRGTSKASDSTTVDNVLKSSKPTGTTAKVSLKKSVRFADASGGPVCNKENDIPSEDELVAATITPTPMKTIPATPKASVVKSVPKSLSRSHQRSISQPLNFDQSTDLKRKYFSEDETPKSRRKMVRVQAAEPESPTMNRKMVIPTPKLTVTSARKPSSAMTPSSKLMASVLETPAKRPTRPLKDTTPAVRAPITEENPFQSAVKTGPLRMSGIKKSSTDIFNSTDSFVCPSDSSKGWQFDSRLSANSAASLSALATPARRPASGLMSASTVAGGKQTSNLSRSLMSCPPKRAGLPMSLSTASTGQKTESALKLSSLATPARRPTFSFAEPTTSSMAKSTPPRVSPMKEPPKRGPGLSPLKSSITMYEIKENSSPLRDRSISPTRRSMHSPERKSMQSPERDSSYLRRSKGPSFTYSVPKKRNSVPSPTKSASPPKIAEVADQIRRKISEIREQKSNMPQNQPSPTNRKLDFGRLEALVKKSPKKSDFDIFVDKPKPTTNAYNYDSELGEDSMTTDEVFGKSPPKTLGTRRESGLFLTSPDRSVSIGPFTTRLEKKSSPLRKEYECDIRRESGLQLGKSPSGNFFLDTMHQSNLTATTPSLMHKHTIIVPLKDCIEELEESDDENENEIAESVVPTAQSIKGPLQDMVIFVEIRTLDGSDASASFVQELIALGAKIVRRWRLNTFGKTDAEINPMGVNLVVFKDGNTQAISKAKRVGVPCVGVAWIKQCSAIKEKVPFDDFLVNEQKGPYSAKKQRRNSLAPKLHKCVTPMKDTKKASRFITDGPVSTPVTPEKSLRSVKGA
ncbi:hypothetical protein TWF694_010143 [Orbilia ellipsospora]|uniref:BRCT domain-containing protein n=1 Tax=Orbilia ellipsospora TaxID=2528407 RepID=A0AAV9X9Z5_9PEZI